MVSSGAGITGQMGPRTKPGSVSGVVSEPIPVFFAAVAAALATRGPHLCPLQYSRSDGNSNTLEGLASSTAVRLLQYLPIQGAATSLPKMIL